ncbi:hypothetical protein [Hymenobacter crusticola]|uniref:Uncharacterized protein n=1 Tax=Hymenobacter crusticola TaxID=1770526 RepID=A0A2C9ZV41_9BACT|nr:hypothetical protein [Hymenobacter crusticola]OUJ70167.1 hypothetical protein BXP70_25290 [Hymenobacter crusticola]
MSAAYDALRQAMGCGDIELTTPVAALLPGDVSDKKRYYDVTALIWQQAAGDWHQHFCEVLDEACVLEMLSYYDTPAPTQENV